MRTILRSISTLILCSSFLVTTARAAPDEWYTYRYDSFRTGAQPYASSLSDPSKVGTLAVKWSFPTTPNGVGAFHASPIVVNDTVFVGNTNGYFYALDAATGALKWQYPKALDPPLLGNDLQWRYGILSSASYWNRSPNGAVIFGAQDPSLGPLGSGARLFALDAQTGAEIWKSEPIATIDGDTTAGQDPLNPPPPASLTELHQRIAFSPPLIFNDKVYVGIHDTRDDPIQTGRVIAVDLATGLIDHAFQFQAVGTPASPPQVRGGAVWNALAADGTGVYFTTGNTRIPWCVWPYNCPLPFEPEPSPNHGLSMIRVNKDTGNIVWKFQPVDFNHDGDPDWAAGATVMSTGCGALIASVQKDGWSYAVNAGNGSMRWQFPPTGLGDTFLGAVHGDDDYRRPGAAWNDVFIVRTGGENLVQDGVNANYGKLHALNTCATTEQGRVRWIADIPNNLFGHETYSAPTVTGGIVFIGTREDPMDHRGHLVVLGDPSVVPPVGWRCSNTAITIPLFCSLSGYAFVPIPKPLASIPMPDGGSLAAIRNEPVLAKGRVFVATHPPNCCPKTDPKCVPPTECAFPEAGHVYMLAPAAITLEPIYYYLLD